MSDRDSTLAINAWGGATEGASSRLHNGCLPSNPDGTWTWRNGVFPASTDGGRTWNYQRDGVAHYGMLWDFVEHVKTLPKGAAAVGGFMTGAEYFSRTWQIAEAASGRVR